MLSLRILIVFFALTLICSDLSAEQDPSPVKITAPGGMRCYLDRNECVTLGEKALANREDMSLEARQLKAHFVDGKPSVNALEDQGDTTKAAQVKSKKELSKLEAFERVHFHRGLTELHAYGSYGLYNARHQTLTLEGKPRLIDPNNQVFGEKQFVYYELENKIVSNGRTTVKNGENLLQGDHAIIYLKPSGKDKTKNTSKGNDAFVSSSEIDRVEVTGNVICSTAKDLIKSDRGVYHAHSQLIDLYDHVRLSNARGIMKGDYGRHDLQTKKSEVFNAHPQVDKFQNQMRNQQRVQAVLIPNRNSPDRLKTRKKSHNDPLKDK